MTTTANETTAIPGAVTGAEVFIPLNKLKKHPNTARKTPHSEASIEAKAASIHAKGTLQNLGLAPGKWRDLLKERGAFHGQAAAPVRHGV